MMEKVFLLFVLILSSGRNKEEKVEISFGHKILEEAKKYVGVRYKFGGRNINGLDCMGLIFLAYSKVTGRDWRKLSVYPSKIIKSGDFGNPVEGLNGVIIEENNVKEVISKMEIGDIIYFLVPYEVGKDKPIVSINEKNYWCLHMAIYAGNGKILHANPFIDDSNKAEVIIELIENFVNRTNIKTLFVTRKK